MNRFAIINFFKKNTIPIVGIIIVITYIIYKNKIIEKYADCPPSDKNAINDMSENAAEACKRISSRAEEIKAHYDGAADIVTKSLAFLSPNNYRSGDNSSTDIMRNIINVNLSKCEVEKINNVCNNSTIISQINALDTKDCEYCNTYGCTISGNIQKNASKTIQLCAIRTAIAALSEKKSSVDAQALAKTLQEAEGILSGSNFSQKENCNLINTDLSTSSYLETKSECLNQLNSTQVNKISGCGSILNNIQENESIALQECMLGATLEKEDKIDSTASASAKAETDQKTTGISTAAMILSLIVSLVLCCIVLGIGYYILESEV